jgi:hypothetical protein
MFRDNGLGLLLILDKHLRVSDPQKPHRVEFLFFHLGLLLAWACMESQYNL